MIFPVAAVLCFVGRWKIRVFCQLLVNTWLYHIQDIPGATSSGCILVVQLVNESTRSAGDVGSIPALGRSPGEGKGYPLQYSRLEISMNYIVIGVTKSWTQLSDFHFHLDSWWLCKNISVPQSICFLLYKMELPVKSESVDCSVVSNSLWHLDCSPPSSSVHGILQARMLESAVMPPPGDLPGPGVKLKCLTSLVPESKFFTTVK